MNILFLGADSGTSLHRANALRRCGHTVRSMCPDTYVSVSRWPAKLHYETGGLLCDAFVSEWVLSEIANQPIDVTWVDNGRYVGPRLIQQLQKHCGPVLNYNVDDPYGRRDRFSWSLYHRAVPFYDLVAVVRQENIAEARQRGARKVLHVFRSADEVAHQPRVLTPADHAAWDSDVAFIGTWMPERGRFMAELLRLGVPLSIRGDFWQKAPEWPELKKAWRGPGIVNDDDGYAKSIQCAKICLGLLSKANRDLHTTRSLEIPFLGGLFCAERTSEHSALYREGEEAVFWADAQECAKQCHILLKDEPKRREISLRGRQQCIQNGTLNEPIVSKVLAAALP